MIIKPSSYFRRPPKILEPNQVTTFNAIRFSVDICDLAYKRLIESLSAHSQNESIPINEHAYPKIFSDVWTIINHAVIFKNIICRELAISEEEDALEEINKAKNLRNTNQHIDERISEHFASADVPIYGYLSWYKIIENTNNSIFTSIYSGVFTHQNKQSISTDGDFPELDGVEIQKIKFTSIKKFKNPQRMTEYSEEVVSIDQIISDMSEYVEHFESQMEVQFKNLDVLERHQSDLKFQLFLKST